MGDGDTWFSRGRCSGYVDAAFDAVLYLQLLVWPEKRICIPKDGVQTVVIREIFARYLVNHPEQRHLPGIEIMSETLKEAFPCKRE
jgi:hypothetical protein